MAKKTKETTVTSDAKAKAKTTQVKKETPVAVTETIDTPKENEVTLETPTENFKEATEAIPYSVQINPYDIIQIQPAKVNKNIRKKHGLKFNGYTWNGASID